MNKENKLMLRAAFGIAQKTGAEAVIVYADALKDLTCEERIGKKFKLILLSRKKKTEESEEKKGTLASKARGFILLPKVQLTRIALIKVATTLAITQELITAGAKLVFAVGAEPGPLDLIQKVDTSKESEIIAGKGLMKIAETVRPEVFQSALNTAIDLANRGREGKNIGTILVLGDHEKVMQMSKQMIMNPFKGYDEEERNILSASLKETIREFSAMDGAFVIAEDGTVLSAGRYLGATVEESTLPRGLGARHLAAAGITSLTNAIAFVISESTGDIRIFKGGRVVMHIEKA